jgi:hypothetical protein
MQMEKSEVGQVLVFLGILIDTVRMMISFDAVQAKGMRMQLQEYLDRISKGRDLDVGTIRAVAGSLNWYSKVLQSGRMHIRSCWEYWRHGPALSQSLRRQLHGDTVWWIRVLTDWSIRGLSGLEYPILSESVLRSNPNSMMILQSDASGIGGMGYFYGELADQNPRYVSKLWSDDYEFKSSHNGELQCLRHFLSETTIRNVVLVWISDSLSGVWSVNKGVCHAEVGLETLRGVLQGCDDKRIQVVALWVPRELNQYADYLSHLSRYAGRDEVRGKVRDHAAPEGAGGAGWQAQE